MNSKTVQLNNTTQHITLSGKHFSVTNYTPDNMYVSAVAPAAGTNLVPGADNVIRIETSTRKIIPECNSNIYLYAPNGGRVELYASDYLAPLGSGGGGGGTTNYYDLSNKPTINNVELTGNRTTADLGIVLPTKVSDLTNDSGFITNLTNALTHYYLKTETYTQSEVNIIIGNLASLNIQVVAVLPTENISLTTIYLVQVGENTSYTQWMYINSTWANLGDTSVDLSNYYTKSESDAKFVEKVTGKDLSTNDFTNTLKTGYDDAVTRAHTHSNSGILDATTASYTTAEKLKLSSIADNANNYSLPTATTSTLGGVKVDGTTITISSGVISSSGGGDDSDIVILDFGNISDIPHTFTAEETAAFMTQLMGCLDDNDKICKNVYMQIAHNDLVGTDNHEYYPMDVWVSKTITPNPNYGFMCTVVVDGIKDELCRYKFNISDLGASLERTELGDSVSIDDTATSATSVWSSNKVNDEITANSYTLPTATDTTLGGVKVDGTTILINNGVISTTAGTDIVTTNTIQTITEQKTFSASLYADGAVALVNPQVRNIIASTEDLTAGTSELTTGTIYFVYE